MVLTSYVCFHSALTTAMDLLYSTDLVCPRLDNEVIAVGGVLSFRSNENPELLLFGDVSRGVLGDEVCVDVLCFFY